MSLLRIIMVTLLSLAPPLLSAEPMYMCSSGKLLNCLRLTESQCTQAFDKALELCSSHHELDEKYNSEGADVAIKVAKCSVTQFKLIANINNAKLQQCYDELEVFNQEYYERQHKLFNTDL